MYDSVLHIIYRHLEVMFRVHARVYYMMSGKAVTIYKVRLSKQI